MKLKNLLVAIAASGAVVAGSLGIATPAFAYTSYSQRTDLWPAGCTGYVAVIGTYQARSDGAVMLTNIHYGNNSTCNVYVNQVNEFWGGTACPVTHLNRQSSNYERLVGDYGSGIETWDWYYPVGSSLWLSKGGHPRWENIIQIQSTGPYKKVVIKPPYGC